MLSLTKPIHINRLPIKLQPKKRIIRKSQIKAALPDPDIVNYSLFQLTSWVLPMTIAGRIMKMEYKDIGVGLIAMGVTKTILETGGIIHY